MQIRVHIFACVVYRNDIPQDDTTFEECNWEIGLKMLREIFFQIYNSSVPLEISNL